MAEKGPSVYRSHLQVPPYHYELEFKYSRIEDKFSIKIIHEKQQIVYTAELDKIVMKKMDASVLATFGNVEAMYLQLVQIAKEMKNINGNQYKNLDESGVDTHQRITISDKGVIKVPIQIAMKSGTKHRDLILETQRRKMTECQILQMRMDRNQKQFNRKEEELKNKVSTLSHNLQNSEKKRKILQLNMNNLEKDRSKLLAQFTSALGQQKQKSDTQISSLKQLIMSLKSNMKQIQFDLKLLMDGYVKIRPKINSNSKNIILNKANSSLKKNYILLQNDSTLMVKVGGSGWTQALLEQPVDGRRPNFYDILIKKSKKNYICCGFGTQQCLSEEDSKWNPHSITLFLLDYSIINCGKSVEDKHKIQNKSQKLSAQQKLIRIIFDPFTKQVTWFINRIKVGQVKCDNSFTENAKKCDVYPLIICFDEGDQIELL